MKPKYIIGIDEVGRGPLAGPVTVAAILLPRNFQFSIFNFQKKLKLKDSKKLSVKQRDLWFNCIKKNKKLFYAVANVSPKIIDKINISQAANLAATRALKKLIMKHGMQPKRTGVFCDGGIFPKIQDSRFKIQTIIKGDEKIPAIAMASIVAKVTRDKKMIRLHKKYPQYEFNKHKGYGTKKHINAIKKHGLSNIHRLTFSKKFH